MINIKRSCLAPVRFVINWIIFLRTCPSVDEGKGEEANSTASPMEL